MTDNEQLNPEDEELIRARFIERLADQVDEDFTHVPEQPRVNAYICQECGHIEFTVDAAEGTTPMALPCLSPPEEAESQILDSTGAPAREEKRCAGVMSSAFYAIKPDDFDLSEIKYEWRSPDVELYLKWRRKKSSLANHIMRGGLVLQNRTDKSGPVLRHDGEFMFADGTLLTDEQVGSHRSSVERLRAMCALHADAQRRKEAAKKKQQEQKRAKLRAKRKAKNKSKKRRR